MKLRFLIPVFALLFIISCGDDPILPQTDTDNLAETQDESENSLNDDENFTTDSDKTDDNTDTAHDDADSTDDSGDSQPDKDADNADSANDSDNNTPDDDDLTVDDDADTSYPANDADEQEDQDNPEADEDGITDNDNEQNDADQDSGIEPEDDEYDFEVVLPYNGDSVDKTIDFDTEIKKIDVLLLVDIGHTSMSTAHDNLKTNKNDVISGIRAKIPDSAFGLINFGLFGENVYELAQPITTDANLIKNQIDAIAPKTTGLKRYHTHALWEAATGEADYEQVAYRNSIGETSYMSINVPAADCSGQEGTIGGACFREGSMPLFIMATNSAFNDLSYDNFGEWKQGEKKTKPKAAEKMNEINAKFIGFSMTTLSTSNLPKDLGYISENTNSLTLSNENFVISETSDNWATKIAETVTNLTENIKLEVKAEFKHVDNEYGVADTTNFVKSFYPTAVQTVKAGDTASFDITFENKIHENNDCTPHNFYITVEAAGEGLVLDSRRIKVIVPGQECSDPF